MNATVTSGTGANLCSKDVELKQYQEMSAKAAFAFCLAAFGDLRGPYLVRADGRIYHVQYGVTSRDGKPADD